MAKNIQAEMSTKIALDLVSATKSVKGLTQAVRSSQSAWKSQEAMLKSSGDYLKAAQAKYEGLGKSIEAQKTKIEALKAKQSELKGNTQETANSYLKFQKDIDSATKQLSSMQAQQERAKSAMQYQESGLAKLQQGYKQMNSVSQSYVQRLEAEGKATEANKAKLGNYKESVTSLSKQLELQEKELERVASTSGKTSSAYANQSKRVNETATALAKTKTDMNSLDSAMKKANPSVFTRIKTAITGTNKQAEKTPSLFKKIVAGGLVTNALSNGFSSLTSAVKSTVSSGLDLAEAGEKSAAAWSAMGKSAGDIKSLGNQVGDLSAKSGLAIATIGGMQKTIDTMTHGNTKMTENITAGVTAIGTASRMSGDQISAFSKSMTKVAASGSLTSTTLARMQKQAPALGAQLAKAAGVSQDAFAKMVANGKVSSADFLNLISKAGKNSGDVYKEFGKTAEGAKAQAAAAWDQLKKKMAAPLLEVKNTGMSELASLMTAPVVQNAATSLGKGLAYVGEKAKDMLAYVSAHKKDVTGIAGDLVGIAKIAGETVWATFKTIISDMGNMFGVSAKKAKNFSNPLGTVHDILDKIVKNKSGIQTTVKVVLGLWAAVKGGEIASKIAKGAIGVISGAMNLFSKRAKIMAAAQKALNFVMEANPWVKLAVVILAVGTALVELYKHNAKFKAFVDGIVKSVQNMWKGMEKRISQMVKGWNDFWKGIGKGWKNFWSNYAKREKKNQADAKKRQDAQNKAISKAMSNFWHGVTKGWSNFWSGIGKWATKGLTNLQKGFASKLNAIHKGWNNIWSSVGKFFSNILSSIKKAGSSALSWLASKFNSIVSGIRRTWNNMWSSIGKFFSNTLGSVKSVAGNALAWLGSKFSSGISSISRGWSRAWSGMSKMFSGIWSGIKSAARSGINGVIGIINGAISGINWVWQKFTGHNAIRKIQKLASGGIVGKMQVAMVNDGAGADWKELYKLPNGQFGMMQDRNAIGMFPVGTRVYNGKETKSIMQAAGIQHYATGGIVGSITNMFKSGWDKAKEVASWLAHPVKNVSKMLTSAVSGMYASTSMFTNLGKGIVSKLVSSVVAWFKKGLKKVSDSLDGGSNVGNPSGTSVTRWKPYVIKALKANGFSASASQVAAWMRVIQRESNGDPTAVNNWDSNAKAGIPSKGLVQTIGPTFAAYAFAGHKNILNGYDDLLAGIHYAKSRYGSGSGMFARVSGPLGYANGGFVNGAAYRLTGEAGPEMIMPLSQAKSSRAWQLLGQAVDRINGGKSNQRTDTAIDNDATTQAILDSNASILTALNSIGELLTQLSFQVTLDTDEVAQKLSPSMQKAQDALTKKQKLLSRTTYTDGGMTISD
jgi:tape measure domain-containing protein